MRVIGITSSPTLSGNTAVLVREVLQGAAEGGATTQEIWLSGEHLRPCAGCFRCMQTGACSLPDGFEAIRRAVQAADGLVLGAPTYGLAPNALMKNFLDRMGMYSVYTSAMRGKYIVGVSTCGTFGAEQVARGLTQIAGGMFGYGKVTGSLGVARGWERIEESPEALDRAWALGRRLARDIAAQRAYPLQHAKDRLITALFVRPEIRRNILEHRTREMKAIYESLTARGLLNVADDNTARHGAGDSPLTVKHYSSENI